MEGGGYIGTLVRRYLRNLPFLGNEANDWQLSLSLTRSYVGNGRIDH